MEERIETNWDNLVVITGKRRAGKSTLGCQLALELTGEIDLSHVAYCADDVLRLLGTLQPHDVLLYDEAVLGLLSHGGARDAELTSLIQAFVMSGEKGINCLCCIPDIGLLDSFMKFGGAEYWLHVYERGRAKVFRAWRGERHRTSVSRYPYDRWDELTPLGFGSLGRTKAFRDYEVHKDSRVNAWLARRRVDPTGKLSPCPGCQRLMNVHNLAEHVQGCGPAQKFVKGGFPAPAPASG